MDEEPAFKSIFRLIAPYSGFAVPARGTVEAVLHLRGASYKSVSCVYLYWGSSLRLC